jgi:hypothetical protein
MSKPFHEAIVGVIQGADALDLRVIGDVIVATKVPKGHDEIIDAWTSRVGHASDSDRVVVSLRAQKLELVD